MIISEPEQNRKHAETDLSPPCKRKKVDACALEDLFGDAFSPPKTKHPPVSPYNQAKDEVRKYRGITSYRRFTHLVEGAPV